MVFAKCAFPSETVNHLTAPGPKSLFPVLFSSPSLTPTLSRVNTDNANTASSYQSLSLTSRDPEDQDCWSAGYFWIIAENNHRHSSFKTIRLLRPPSFLPRDLSSLPSSSRSNVPVRQAPQDYSQQQGINHSRVALESLPWAICGKCPALPWLTGVLAKTGSVPMGTHCLQVQKPSFFGASGKGPGQEADPRQQRSYLPSPTGWGSREGIYESGSQRCSPFSAGHLNRQRRWGLALRRVHV